MNKRMIVGIAAGVIAGATVVGVPAIAIATNDPGTGSGVPGIGQMMNDPEHVQQMQQWMNDPEHVRQMQQWMNDPEHVRQMQQWMNDPEHLQQMGSMMDGAGPGSWNGMHRFGNQAADPTP